MNLELKEYDENSFPTNISMQLPIQWNLIGDISKSGGDARFSLNDP
jgi:hypothetical protein